MFVYPCNIKEKERYLIDHNENFSVRKLYNEDITIIKLSVPGVVQFTHKYSRRLPALGLISGF